MITFEAIKRYQTNFANNQAHQATAYAAASSGIQAACLDPQATANHTFTYSVTTEMGEITNQKSSGRCWMFASLNAARTETMKKFNLKTLEFSQSYTFFWDKLEKSNAFLESIIATADQDIHGRLLTHLLKDPIQDGGQWDMYSGILAKYGIVPKNMMPETFHSSQSGPMVNYLTSKLREYACELRTLVKNQASSETINKRKDEMLEYVYAVLVKCLGTPPTEVVFEYYDKDNKFHRSEKMTPQQFLKEYVGWNLEDKFSLINAPTDDKPYYNRYTVKYLHSVVEGPMINYINLPIEELKQSTIASLKAGEPVWFGCDVAKYLDNKTGIMDTRQYNHKAVLGEALLLDKAQRLDYGDSLLTHAMVITGVNLDENGKPLTWKIENSWSDKSGHKGVYSMSDEWFDEFTYEVMVDRKYMSKEALAVLDKPIIELEAWDPMGALAF